jgi:predicted GNAT family acetyltransferase
MLYPLSYGGPTRRLTGATGTLRAPDSSVSDETQPRFPGLPSGYTSSSGNGAGGREGERTMDTKVVDVPEKGRFEVRIDDRVVGLASYHVDGGTMTLPHTEVDPSMGGRGIGTALVAGVLDAARERGLHVLPYCSFVRHYIEQHPETVDLVDAGDRGRFGLEPATR